MITLTVEYSKYVSQIWKGLVKKTKEIQKQISSIPNN